MSPDRAAFRARLLDPAAPPVQVPLTLEPLVARLCEQLGFEAGYVSGGALGYSLATSEALLTLTELASAVAAITRRSNLPIVVDGGVGFGDPVHAARMMWDFEAAGAVAVEIEDQVAPKRVSHHRGVEHLVPLEDMVAKIRVAVEARRDPDFLVIARTGAVHNEGFDAALARAEAYVAAGADAILLFADSPEQWAALRERVAGVPLVAMTGLDVRSSAEWADLGVRMVIDPFTGQVVAFDAMRRALRGQRDDGDAGVTMKERMSVYKELPVVAGLEELYDIERATTEPGT